MTAASQEKPGSRRSRLTRIASGSARALSSALSRFPFAVLAIGLLALLVDLEIAHIRLFDERNELRLGSALAVGAAVSIGVALLFERAEMRFAAGAAGASAAGLVAALAVWFGWDGVLFVPPLLAAAILFVPLSAHIVRSNGLRFWTFTLWTSFGAALGFLSVLLFVLGVSAILEMVRYLFGIGLSGDAYEHIYATAVLFVGPVFALGRIPRDFDEEAAIGQGDRFTTGIAVLQNWVALPLVLAAAAILHLYVAKIFVTGEVPRNQIGWIVGFYALFVLSLRVACAPFVAVGGAAARLFGRLWVPILVVPLALLFYALWLRVATQGFTAERYYLGLAALSAMLIVIVQAVAVLRSDIRVMVAVPVLALTLSSFGPLSVAAVVGRSQTALIARDFVAGPDNRLHPDRLDDKQRDILRSRVSALAEVEALPRLHPMMTDEARAIVEGPSPQDDERAAYLKALGLDYGAGSPAYVTFAGAAPGPFDVAGFDLVQVRLEANEGGLPPDPDPTRLTTTIEGRQLVLRLHGIVDRVDPAPIADRVKGRGTGADAVVIDMRTLGGRSVRLRVTSLVRLETAPYPVSAGFDVALRAAEWPAASLGGDGNR